MSNFMSNENATEIFDAVGERLGKRPSTFTGTTAQWNAMTAEEQVQYEIVNLTDDYTPDGGGSSICIEELAEMIDDLLTRVTELEGKVNG